MFLVEQLLRKIQITILLLQILRIKFLFIQVIIN